MQPKYNMYSVGGQVMAPAPMGSLYYDPRESERRERVNLEESLQKRAKAQQQPVVSEQQVRAAAALDQTYPVAYQQQNVNQRMTPQELPTNDEGKPIIRPQVRPTIQPENMQDLSAGNQLLSQEAVVDYGPAIGEAMMQRTGDPLMMAALDPIVQGGNIRPPEERMSPVTVRDKRGRPTGEVKMVPAELEEVSYGRGTRKDRGQLRQVLANF